jgi:hypothetical protein
VIDLACELMGRAMQVLTRAGVRQRYGNISSATIVFILEELMRSQEAMCGDWGLMSPRAWLRSGREPCSDGSQFGVAFPRMASRRQHCADAKGVVVAPLAKCEWRNIRICRPHGIRHTDLDNLSTS